jgi:hypothetical protein
VAYALKKLHLTIYGIINKTASYYKKPMRLTFTILGLLIISDLFSQTFKEKELKTEINEVTVFLKGAQIFETGTATIPPGRTILRIKNLSPYLDEKSIQVKAEGNFTILSVNHKFNYLNELKKDSKMDSLLKLLDVLELGISPTGADVVCWHVCSSSVPITKCVFMREANYIVQHLRHGSNFRAR